MKRFTADQLELDPNQKQFLGHKKLLKKIINGV